MKNKNIFIRKNNIILEVIDKEKPQRIREISRNTGFTENHVIKICNMHADLGLVDIIYKNAYDKSINITLKGKNLLFHLRKLEEILKWK